MTASIFRDLHGAGNSPAVTSDLSTTNAGAISLETPTTRLSTAGAETRTLAAGVEGQLKALVMTVDGGDCVVTLTGNPAASDTITFNDVDDNVLLLYTASRWIIVCNNGCTVA